MKISEPEEVIHHPLLKQDVDKILQPPEIGAQQWALGFFFGGLGFLQNILYVLKAITNSKVPSLIDVLLSLLCIGCLAIGAAKYTQYRKERRQAEDMRDRLDKRPLKTWPWMPK